MAINTNFLENQSVQNLSGLDNLRKAALSNEDGALEQAAKQFESIFMSMLIKSMRDVNEVFKAEGPLNSNYTKQYEDMYDQQLSSELSSNGSLGLADLIVKQLGGGDGSYKNADHFKPLGRQVSNTAYDNANEAVIKKTEPTTEKVSASSGLVSAASNAIEPMFNGPADFVRKILPLAEKLADKLPVNPLTVVAQAALETGWGKKMIKSADGSPSFNLFGIKADSHWQGQSANVNTLEYRNGVAAKERANFRAYQSLEHSIADYGKFIGDNPRYQEAAKSTESRAYVEALQDAGYATDPLYAEKIMAVMKSEIFKQAQNLHSDTQSTE